MDLTRYGYDRTSGVYVGPVAAIPDPERPGAALEPAFCTDEAPPVADGQAAVWSGKAWSLAPDHRGETWFSGRDPVLIADVGDPAAHGLTPAPAPLPPPAPASSCSKLGLKRAFAEKGLWPTPVRAMIASDDELQEDWDLAVELRITDPIVRKAVAGLAVLGVTLSPDDVQALVTRANELVA